MTLSRNLPTRNSLSVFLLWSAALLAAPGCAKWNLDESLAILESEPKPQTPDRVLAVWTDTTLNQPGKSAVRGFGGRIMFFASGNEDKAVPVEGSVIVYAFDDQRPDPQQTTPEKKFMFPAKNLAIHQSDSSLGPSYSFWLPWDNAGGPQRRLSLLTRFEDASGKIVLSKAANVTLPGIVPADSPRNAEYGTGGSSLGHPFVPPLAVQQTGYQERFPDPFQAAESGRITQPLSTSTIDVTPGQAQRLLVGQGLSRSDKPSVPTSPWGPLTVDRQTIAAGSTASPATSPAPQAEAAAYRQVAPATGSARGQSPVRTSTATRPASAPVRRQPHHAEWLRPLPPTPRSGWTTPPAVPTPSSESAEN